MKNSPQTTLFPRRHTQERKRATQSRANIRRLYGITYEQFQEMLSNQAGLCAMCTQPMTPGHKTHIDHNHACCPGKKSCGACIRGLLCAGCNLAVSAVERHLYDALAYLSKGLAI